MDVKNLTKTNLKKSLLELMDNVQIAISQEKDVDTFLDKTDLFDEWENILPHAEYPIFVMTVLNNIRKESIINVLVDSVLNNPLPSKQNKIVKPKPTISMIDGHPFC